MSGDLQPENACCANRDRRSGKNAGSCVASLIKVLVRCVPQYQLIMDTWSHCVTRHLLSDNPDDITAIANAPIDTSRADGEPYLDRIRSRARAAGFNVVASHAHAVTEFDDAMQVDV